MLSATYRFLPGIFAAQRKYNNKFRILPPLQLLFFINETLVNGASSMLLPCCCCCRAVVVVASWLFGFCHRFIVLPPTDCGQFIVWSPQLPVPTELEGREWWVGEQGRSRGSRGSRRSRQPRNLPSDEDLRHESRKINAKNTKHIKQKANRLG